MLTTKKIKHEVLNAKIARELRIVLKLVGAITIATNMAGRGTDIKLGEGIRGRRPMCCGTNVMTRRADNQLRRSCWTSRRSDSRNFMSH